MTAYSFRSAGGSEFVHTRKRVRRGELSRINATNAMVPRYTATMRESGHTPLQEKMLTTLRSRGVDIGHRVVDIGCGTGELLSYILKVLFTNEIQKIATEFFSTKMEQEPLVLVGIDENKAAFRIARRTLEAELALIGAGLQDTFRKYGRVQVEKNDGNENDLLLVARRNGSYESAIVRVRLVKRSGLTLTNSRSTAHQLADGADTFLFSYIAHWLFSQEREQIFSAVAQLMSRTSDLPPALGISIEEFPLNLPRKEVWKADTKTILKWFEGSNTRLGSVYEFLKVLDKCGLTVVPSYTAFESIDQVGDAPTYGQLEGHIMYRHVVSLKET